MATRTGGAGRRPTIRDVAALSGLSTGTVSRVLNDSPRVSPEARERVRAAIEASGFRTNASALALATGRSRSIAFLVTNPRHSFFTDPTFAVMLEVVAREATARGQALVLLMGSDEESVASTLSYLRAGHVDGLVHTTPQRDDPILAGLAGSGLPVVCAGLPYEAEGQVGVVSADNVGGGRIAAELLRDLGRRRPVHLAGPSGVTGSRDRLTGFEEGWGAPLPPGAIAEGDYGYDSGLRAMRALLDAVPDLDAVFCANDMMASAALRVLAADGRRVPEDVAVVGFDNHDLGERTEPPLTTIDQNIDGVAQAAIGLLEEMLDGAPPRSAELATSLVRRASA
jgi:LacI family transcriptional regulator, repressor for deo operon, udp, cdd, tsx, nupC, and nupG